MHLWNVRNSILIVLILGLEKFQVASANGYRFDCEEYPTVIRLSSQNVSDLQAIGSDNIVISREFTINPVPHPCSANVTQPYFSINLIQCNPYVEMTNEFVYVTWTVRNQPRRSAVIERYNESCLNFTCCFNRTSMLRSDQLRPILRQLEVQVAQQTGQFSWTLQLYSDSSHTHPIPPLGSVVVDDRIYVWINLTNFAFEPSRLVAQVRSCWATPTSMPSSSVRYDLITSSCPVTANQVMVTQNYMNRYAAFNFRSFVWRQNFSWPIYVHCSVASCDTAATDVNCTSLNCTSARRKRRDIEEADEVLSFGPIKITPINNEEVSCSENNGGCSDVCSMVNEQILCLCPAGSVLGRDRKTCVVETGRPITVIQSYVIEPISNLENPFYILAIVMVVICLLTGVVYVFTQKKMVKPMVY